MVTFLKGAFIVKTKTKRGISISLALILAIGLSGCTNKDKPDPNDTLQNVYDSFLPDYEKCKTKDYENLEFSDCAAKIPKLVTCSNLNVTIEYQSTPNKDVLQSFKDYVTFFLGEYNPENALFIPSPENTVHINSEADGKYAWYPKINDYVEQIQNDSLKINSFLYRDIDNSKYLWWNVTEDYPHWVSKGEAYSFIKTDDTKISSWIPSDMENKVASYFNDGTNNDKTYRLIGGDVSIGDAINYFEKEYLSSLPYKANEKYSISVSSIDVYNIKDDLYAYVFNFSTAWNAIPFDRLEETFSYQDTSHQYQISGEALMIKSNDIDTVVNLSFPCVKETGDPIKNICRLEKAIDIMSSKLTKAVKFDVQTIELVYVGNYSEDYTSAYLEPSWKFSTYNPNDSLYYCVYVNAVSGECKYVSYK